MLNGILSAVLVTLAWIFLQNLTMHIKPAKGRLKAMTLSYLFSLPLIYPVWRWAPALIPTLGQTAAAESPVMGVFHAYLFHLLLFLLYVECFYHVERSVTLRFLVEILTHSIRGSRIEDIQCDYNIQDMITRRMALLEQNGFIERKDGRWRLLPKARRLARAMQVSCCIFQSKTQDERL